eukprot:7123963-Karenia_brevis.AAC.1
MNKPKSKADLEAICMNGIRKGSDPKLHLGMTGPRAKAHPKATAMNAIKRGYGPELHFGYDWARGPP